MYHPGDYSYPHSVEQRFEICVGAVLTQNTSWRNVESVLVKPGAGLLLSPGNILSADTQALTERIRSVGYYNQKAKKLRILARFFDQCGDTVPNRAQLLGLWGVGPETADSMLLYAFAQAEMVVDTYTIRILAGEGMIPATATYAEAKEYCKSQLPRDVIIYQEFHALMVAHAKYKSSCFADGRV